LNITLKINLLKFLFFYLKPRFILTNKKNIPSLNLYLKTLNYKRFICTQSMFHENNYLCKEAEAIFVKLNEHLYSYFHTKSRNI